MIKAGAEPNDDQETKFKPQHSNHINHLPIITNVETRDYP